MSETSNCAARKSFMLRGSQEPSVWAGMSLATFCAENKKKGEFLVVVALSHFP